MWPRMAVSSSAFDIVTGVGRYGVAVAAAAAVKDSFSRSAILRAVIGVWTKGRGDKMGPRLRESHLLAPSGRE